MKKQIFRKVLAALFILAVSCYVVNLQAQDVIVEFTNPDGLDYGSSNDGFDGTGLGGRGDDAVDDEWVSLNFTIAATGQIALDVTTATTYLPVVDVLKTWNTSNIGSTTNADLFGKSFSLVLTAESRMQLGKDVDGNRGGIGVQGKNQRRIDDLGDNNEWMEFELAGDVGIQFVRLGYNDVGGDAPNHAVIIDHDTEKWWDIIDGVDGNPHPPELYIDGADYSMRYFTDKLRFTTSDTVHTGYRIYSLEFNLVNPDPKPPAVADTDPARGDSLSMNIADDYVITFDGPMDQTATSAAVTISPAVTGRADAWSAEGDVLTISFDDLDYGAWYEVVVSTAALGTNALNMLMADTITFKTLPEPPSVVSTFPENLAMDIPIDSPISFVFSKSMIDTTVEKAVKFTPELAGLSFVWNEDYSAVYISSDELMPSTMYFAEVGAEAMDEFEIMMPEPFLFAFTTSIATSVESKASELSIYPNPASDVLQISGVDVASAKLYNVTGQMVKMVYNSSVISVSDIETGIYFIDVTDRQDMSYKQMILVK